MSLWSLLLRISKRPCLCWSLTLGHTSALQRVTLGAGAEAPLRQAPPRPAPPLAPPRPSPRPRGQPAAPALGVSSRRSFRAWRRRCGDGRHGAKGRAAAAERAQRGWRPRPPAAGERRWGREAALVGPTRQEGGTPRSLKTRNLGVPRPVVPGRGARRVGFLGPLGWSS